MNFLLVGDSFKPVTDTIQAKSSSRLTFLCFMHAETVCPEDKKLRVRRRNDAITIAVGSTLAVISVVTVVGYVIYILSKSRLLIVLPALSR
jgi:hypothetical protein